MARMSVPKMLKNGQNSALTTENRTAPTQKIRKLEKFKTVLKAQKGTKIISSQFRDKATRSSNVQDGIDLIEPKMSLALVSTINTYGGMLLGKSLDCL